MGFREIAIEWNWKYIFEGFCRKWEEGWGEWRVRAVRRQRIPSAGGHTSSAKREEGWNFSASPQIVDTRQSQRSNPNLCKRKHFIAQSLNVILFVFDCFCFYTNKTKQKKNPLWTREEKSVYLFSILTVLCSLPLFFFWVLFLFSNACLAQTLQWNPLLREV